MTTSVSVSQPPRKSPPSGCLALFGLPFAAVSVFMLYLATTTGFSILTMSGWPTVPGRIVSTNLETHTTSKGGNTHKARAKFSYSVNGTDYVGERVSLYSPDNIGKFQRDTQKQLDELLASGGTIPVHYNPHDPQESILFPVIRWEMFAIYAVFMVVFGLVGFGLMFGIFSTRKAIRQQAKLAVERPGEPWLYREEWRSGKIRSAQRGNAIIVTCLALFWNAVTSPVLFILGRELRRGNYYALFFLIFQVVGVCLLWAAAVAIARWRRFGRTTFELSSLPARPGEALRGRILAPTSLSASEVTLKLSCQRTTRTSAGATTTVTFGGKRRHSSTTSNTKVDTVWSTETTAAVMKGMSATGDNVIKVDIPIPAGQPSTTIELMSDLTIQWRLTAKASLQGADFEAEFDVPVFA